MPNLIALVRQRRQLLTYSSLAIAFLNLTCAQPAWSQASTWPTKPVRLLVGFPAGSTPDLSARTLAEPLAKALGQPVIVENKPGASGNIAADQVAKATDDHTLGVVINGNLTSARILNPKLPFDPAHDFSFLSLLTTAPLMLVAPSGQPSGAAFFKTALSQGDKWSYASPGNGTVAHLGMEWLKAKAGGLSVVHVPYASNPQLVTAMLGGQIHMALVPPGIAMPHVRSGKLQAVGLTTSGRSVLVPEVPPLSDAGVKDFTLEVWTALVGPAKLSVAAQKRLSTEVSTIVRSQETRQRLFAQGWQAVGSSPEGLKKRVESETKVLGDIITRQSIQAE